VVRRRDLGRALGHALALVAYPQALALTACSHAPAEPERPDSGPANASPQAIPSPPASASATRASLVLDAGQPDAEAEAGALESDPMARHYESPEELLRFVDVRDAARFRRKGRDPDAFLAATFGPNTPSRINQGNKAIAHHAIARAQCLAGLEGVTIQTDEQKHVCGGMPNMVPIFKKGKAARACIDVFEFPNRACELPMVWASPIQAQLVCQLEGKRLCSQEEWILACRGDPEGGADRAYSYGDELDLEACNTNKPAASFKDTVCDADSAGSAWKTCGTNTEPTGSFPRCRSRFGVFDQQGNVAEIMTRLDPDGTVYSQLKGSAFFYVDVARKPGEKPPKGRETYPDMCGHDPRWHVEPMDTAWHVNYHLGFRCCKTVR
jgi:hypothetical protein